MRSFYLLACLFSVSAMSACCSSAAGNADCPATSECVCAFDSYCCAMAWDEQCVKEAEDRCQLDCSVPECIPGECIASATARKFGAALEASKPEDLKSLFADDTEVLVDGYDNIDDLLARLALEPFPPLYGPVECHRPRFTALYSQSGLQTDLFFVVEKGSSRRSTTSPLITSVSSSAPVCFVSVGAGQTMGDCPDDAQLAPGSSCQIGCAQNYELSGSSKVSCSAIGGETGPSGTCVQTYRPSQAIIPLTTITPTPAPVPPQATGLWDGAIATGSFDILASVTGMGDLSTALFGQMAGNIWSGTNTAQDVWTQEELENLSNQIAGVSQQVDGVQATLDQVQAELSQAILQVDIDTTELSWQQVETPMTAINAMYADSLIPLLQTMTNGQTSVETAQNLMKSFWQDCQSENVVNTNGAALAAQLQSFLNQLQTTLFTSPTLDSSTYTQYFTKYAGQGYNALTQNLALVNMCYCGQSSYNTDSYQLASSVASSNTQIQNLQTSVFGPGSAPFITPQVLDFVNQTNVAINSGLDTLTVQLTNSNAQVNGLIASVLNVDGSRGFSPGGSFPMNSLDPSTSQSMLNDWLPVNVMQTFTVGHKHISQQWVLKMSSAVLGVSSIYTVYGHACYEEFADCRIEANWFLSPLSFSTAAYPFMPYALSSTGLSSDINKLTVLVTPVSGGMALVIGDTMYGSQDEPGSPNTPLSTAQYSVALSVPSNQGGVVAFANINNDLSAAQFVIAAVPCAGLTGVECRGPGPTSSENAPTFNADQVQWQPSTSLSLPYIELSGGKGASECAQECYNKKASSTEYDSYDACAYQCNGCFLGTAPAAVTSSSNTACDQKAFSFSGSYATDSVIIFRPMRLAWTASGGCGGYSFNPVNLWPPCGSGSINMGPVNIQCNNYGYAPLSNAGICGPTSVTNMGTANWERTITPEGPAGSTQTLSAEPSSDAYTAGYLGITAKCTCQVSSTCVCNIYTGFATPRGYSNVNWAISTDIGAGAPVPDCGMEQSDASTTLSCNNAGSLASSWWLPASACLTSNLGFVTNKCGD